MYTVRQFNGMRVIDNGLANMDEVKLAIEADCKYAKECSKFYAVLKDGSTRTEYFIQAEYMDDGDWHGKIFSRVGDTDDWTTTTWDWTEFVPVEGEPWPTER